MIVYHGSNSNFKTLRINKKLVKHDSTLTNEGLGIYFSTDKSVCESYGRYMYTLEINDKCFSDFRKINTCKRYVNAIRQEILKATGIEIARYVDLNSVAVYVHDGKVAVSGTCNEIYMLLDSNGHWYELGESRIQKVYKILDSYDKKHLKAYMFNYNIKDTGVIKDVSDNVVRIVDKGRNY